MSTVIANTVATARSFSLRDAAPSRHRLHRHVALSLALSWPVLASAYCEGPANAPDSKEPLLSDLVPFSAVKSTEPSIEATGRTQLSELVRTAVAASADNRGAEHGRAAAAFDLAQTRAGTSPQVTLNSSLGVGGGSQGDASFGTTGVNTVGLALSAPLYDGGRIDALTRYREQLLGVSSSTVGTTRERVAREAVLTVLERNRYSLQLKVYQQHVTKLACLTRSIEQIVQADPGRASEQVQARKSLRQAEIARDEAQSSLRQAESRLTRIVGEQPSLWTAAGVPLVEVPALETVLAQSRFNPEVHQLRLQADALTHYARATTAEQSPQVRWQAGVNSARQYTQVTSQSWNVGLALNYTLADGGANRAASGAAQERAEAARQAWENALNERAKQAAAQHDAARNAFQRAQHYGELLSDSDTLRNATYVQWIKLGRRSLFDLISAESEHHQLRLSYVNALHDGYTASTQLRNAGGGLLPWLAPELATTTPP